MHNATAMYELNHSYATRAMLIRRAVDAHRAWIEERLGVRLSETVILETELSFCDAAISRLIGYGDRYAAVTTPNARLAEQLQSVEIPPSQVPIIQLTRERAIGVVVGQPGAGSEESCAYSMEWGDCPLLLRVRSLPVPVVALCVSYHPGPESMGESKQDVVVTSRQSVEAVMTLMKALTSPDGKAKLKVGCDDPEAVTKCDWDQLVLDQSVVSLLKDDFESFFEREAWIRKMRLPFRRGYLLHGPPGNGKSSAIRAMLNSRGLTAYTIRFFDPNVDDRDLARLFMRAAENAPAIVSLEDIDRVFPRTGESKTKISLQQLLNCLDGVASGEGIVTVATANEPTALDPAILKRPGRFDRVVLFPNPTPELRRGYFAKMHPSFAYGDLYDAVEETDGFSFAQLRECYIMAGQKAFTEDREITVDDLVGGIWSLRRTVLFASLKTTASAGFPVSGPVGRSKRA